MSFKFKKYLQSSSDIFAENKILRFAIVMIFIITLINSVSINRIRDSVERVIVPVGSASNFVLTGSSANDEYLSAMAKYITYSISNLTPATARKQLGELLLLVDSASYSKYRDRFTSIADMLEKYPSISYFATFDGSKPITIKDQKLSVKIQKNKVIGNTIAKQTDLTLNIIYTIQNAEFKIKEIQEVGGEKI